MSLTQNVASPAAERILDKVHELAVLPHVVFKVLEISGNSDAPAGDLERVIAVDPGFSSRVLSMANSASFALPKKVTSVKDAIMFLGFKTVRSIAMAAGVFDLFVGKTDEESLRRRSWWRHSLDTAVIARWLADTSKTIAADEAYTCGLLHTIGKTLIDRFGEGEYSKVAFLMERGATDRQAEKAVYGCEHTEVGVVAAKKWGFPAELVAGMDYLNDAAEEFTAHRACTALASRLAQLARDGVKEGDSLPTWTLKALGFAEADTQFLIDEATAHLAKAQMHV
jgi:putative nucleotidyltransferase with HDIG domain